MEPSATATAAAAAAAANSAAISVMPTYAIVGLIVIGIITVLPLGAAVLFVGLWVGRVETKAMNGEKVAELARERAQDVGAQLAAFKLEAQQSFVQHAAMEKLETRLMGAIENISARIDRLLDKAQA